MAPGKAQPFRTERGRAARVSLREATFGFGMLALELWTFDFFVYSIEKYFASG